MGVNCCNLSRGQSSEGVTPGGNQFISIRVWLSDPDVCIAFLITSEKQRERLNKFNDGNLRLETSYFLALQHSFVFPKSDDFVSAATGNNVQSARVVATKNLFFVAVHTTTKNCPSVFAVTIGIVLCLVLRCFPVHSASFCS